MKNMIHLLHREFPGEPLVLHQCQIAVRQKLGASFRALSRGHQELGDLRVQTGRNIPIAEGADIQAVLQIAWKGGDQDRPDAGKFKLAADLGGPGFCFHDVIPAMLLIDFFDKVLQGGGGVGIRRGGVEGEDHLVGIVSALAVSFHGGVPF